MIRVEGVKEFLSDEEVSIRGGSECIGDLNKLDTEETEKQ